MTTATAPTSADTAPPARANLNRVTAAQRRALTTMLGSTTRRFGMRCWLSTDKRGQSLRIKNQMMRKLADMGLASIGKSGASARLTAIGQWYAATAAVLAAEATITKLGTELGHNQ